jgi:hypothetical protein
LVLPGGIESEPFCSDSVRPKEISQVCAVHQVRWRR